jgi:hypothetical protein
VLARASQTASLELRAAAAWTRLIATHLIKETSELVGFGFGDGLDVDCELVAASVQSVQRNDDVVVAIRIVWWCLRHIRVSMRFAFEA